MGLIFLCPKETHENLPQAGAFRQVYWVWNSGKEAA